MCKAESEQISLNHQRFTLHQSPQIFYLPPILSILSVLYLFSTRPAASFSPPEKMRCYKKNLPRFFPLRPTSLIMMIVERWSVDFNYYMFCIERLSLSLYVCLRITATRLYWLSWHLEYKYLVQNLNDIYLKTFFISLPFQIASTLWFFFAVTVFDRSQIFI